MATVTRGTGPEPAADTVRMRTLVERVGGYCNSAGEAVEALDDETTPAHPAQMLAASYAMAYTADALAMRVGEPYAVYRPEQAGELIADAARTVRAACDVMRAAAERVGAMAQHGALGVGQDDEADQIVRLAREQAAEWESIAGDGMGLAARTRALGYRGDVPTDMPGLLGRAGEYLRAAGASGVTLHDRDPDMALQLAFDYRGRKCAVVLDPLSAWSVAADDLGEDLTLAPEPQVHPAQLAEHTLEAIERLVPAELGSSVGA